MFCPRCGQQAAEGVSFCSRCGFSLGAAAELVKTGGELARPGANAGLTPRQRGTRKGLTIAGGGLLFFGVAALLTAYRDELFPFLIIAGVILTVGVMRMLYALLLEGHAPPKEAPPPPAELASQYSRAAELPPARAVPINVYAEQGARTKDMAAPPTVTEGTTRLLDEDEG